MRRKRKYLAVAAVLFVATAAAVPDRFNEHGGPEDGPPIGLATLQHDPQFILETVARRMGVTLRPDVPPAIRLESETPLERLQAAAEKQWGFRPHAFVTTYATASNEVYLIDEAALYDKSRGTLDDALAHELVHYVQARYLADRFDTDWSESEAVAIQTWFRKEFMSPMPGAARARHLATQAPASRAAPAFEGEPPAGTAGSIPALCPRSERCPSS